MAKTVLGLIIIFIGISALLGVFLVKFIFALILIAVGIRIISGRRRHRDWDAKTISGEDTINEVAIFSPINKIIKTDNFKGGKMVMIFSGGQLDISGVKTSEKEIDLEFVAVFGGGKLIVPKGWRVNSQGTAIFGGYNNRTEKQEGGENTVLNIKGAAIFGGIEIVN